MGTLNLPTHRQDRRQRLSRRRADLLRNRTRLQLEALEARQLLSADVSLFIGPMQVGVERPEVVAPITSSADAGGHISEGQCSALPSQQSGGELHAAGSELEVHEDGEDHPVFPREPQELIDIDNTFYASRLEAAIPTGGGGGGIANSPAYSGGGSGNASAFGSFNLADTFFLHSKPDATKTIYLDFDGFVAVGTPWSPSNPVDTPPYDPSNDGDAFNDSELMRIQDIWLRVAEDFAPFDLNVTTEEPPEEDLVNEGGGDDRWGIRVVVTPDDWAPCGCGGFAYINSFNWGYNQPGATDTPVYVFNQGALAVAAAASHEVGHALGLSHDGTSSLAYYNGHGTGENGWIPIMGSGYYQNVSTWDAGEYSLSNNDNGSANYGRGPDDLGIISSVNGFGYRTDDAGDSIAFATEVDYLGINASDPDLEDIGKFGIISDRNDLDYFQFVTGAGTINIDILSYVGRAHISDGAGGFNDVIVDSDYRDTMGTNVQTSNLDISATLFDSSGSVIATSDLVGLNAGFNDINVSAGAYYISVDGTSFGDPFASSPTGYTDYASLGQYLITGTIVPVGGPIASANAPDIEQKTVQDQIITVTYADRDGVDVSTLGSGDITVTGPDGYDVAGTFLSVNNNTNGSPRTAYYSVPAPAGIWNSDASGLYTITLEANEVADVNGSFSDEADVGDFNVDIVPTIGPDGFSYVADPAAYNFIDISSTGTLVLDGEDEALEEIVPDGFSFDFYGETYDSVFVTSNGLVTFGGPFTYPENTDLTEYPPVPALAALWDDLAARDDHGVFWQLMGEGDEQQLILQWSTRYFGSPNGPDDLNVSFQVVLDEADESLTIHYENLEVGHSTNDGGAGATVGIKDSGAQGDNRLLVAFDQPDNGYAKTGRALKFTVSNVAPEDILLVDDNVNENAAAGTAVGTLITTDGNATDSHIYSLVSGAGDDDNALFTISGDQLLTAAVFDAKVKDTYSVRVMTEDPYGSTYEKQLTISVNDLVQVDSITLDDTPQRSRVDEIRVVFDGETDIESGAFSVSQRGGSDVITSFTTETDGQGRTVAVITFAGPLTRAGGALVDGNYELLIDATKVSRNGLIMDGDADGNEGGDVTFGDEASDNFFALYGDSDGNRTIDVTDFLAFRSEFGSTGSVDDRFDFDGDDDIDVDDFLAFRTNFGSTLGFN